MSDLTINEKKILENFFDMKGGYLLDHSNASLTELVNSSVGIDLYSDRYCLYSNSKANRMRAIWELEHNQLVGRLIRCIIEDYSSSASSYPVTINQALKEQCLSIATRLERSNQPPATGIPTKMHPVSQHIPNIPPPSSHQGYQQITNIPPPSSPQGYQQITKAPPAPHYIPENNPAAASAVSQNVIVNKNKVFIVHGHDELSKEQLARFVTTVGLAPIILHEQVSSSKTIIEKFEDYANEVCFAIVLYSPCDVGSKAGAQTTSPRARQNVVFEHGYFIGKLGRENVTAIVKGDIETPNDISGVVYEVFDNGGAWKYKLAREMKVAGCDIDMNKIF